MGRDCPRTFSEDFSKSEIRWRVIPLISLSQFVLMILTRIVSSDCVILGAEGVSGRSEQREKALARVRLVRIYWELV